MLFPGCGFGFASSVMVLVYNGDMPIFGSFMAGFLCLAIILHIQFRSYFSILVFSLGFIIMDQILNMVPWHKVKHTEYYALKQHYLALVAPQFVVAQALRLKNDTQTYQHQFEAAKPVVLNPFAFLFFWYFGTDLPCQVPYIHMYTLWCVFVPGLFLQHCINYNSGSFSILLFYP